MRLTWLMVVFCIAMSAFAAPPPDSNGKFRDWFQSLRVPNVSNDAICCTVADCRMVAARWNYRTQHYEAEVNREVFANALQDSAHYTMIKRPTRQREGSGYRTGLQNSAMPPRFKSRFRMNGSIKSITQQGIRYYVGQRSTVQFNGVFCFVPFYAAANDHTDRTTAYG